MSNERFSFRRITSKWNSMRTCIQKMPDAMMITMCSNVSLKDKKALIAGASGGIGWDTAAVFAQLSFWTHR